MKEINERRDSLNESRGWVRDRISWQLAVGQLDSWTVGQLDSWTIGNWQLEPWNSGTLEQFLGIWNNFLESGTISWNLEPGIWNLESGIFLLFSDWFFKEIVLYLQLFNSCL